VYARKLLGLTAPAPPVHGSLQWAVLVQNKPVRSTTTQQRDRIGNPNIDQARAPIV
jgi:hypothetical protein